MPSSVRSAQRETLPRRRPSVSTHGGQNGGAAFPPDATLSFVSLRENDRGQVLVLKSAR
jgi:hypothetical protein